MCDLTRSALVAVAVLAAGDALAQSVPEPEEVGGAAVWHDAQRYRDLLAGGPHAAEMLAQAMEAELALGRPAGALELLEAYGGDTLSSHARILPLRAAAELGLDHAAESGRLFTEAARRASDPLSTAIYAARAGDAFRQAGMEAAANERYEEARHRLTTVAGWIAVRQAVVAADTAGAFALLARAPSAAAPFAARARAARLLAAGDTAAAVPALVAGGRPGAAAGLALARGDTTLAHAIAYAALNDRDTAVVRSAVELVTPALRPDGPSERLRVARAHRRLGNARLAARLVGEAVAGGDSSTATLLLWGDLLSADGRRAAALDAYTYAAARGDPEGAYRHARLLVGLGRRTDGYAALLRFADRYPDHGDAPVAVYLVADGYRALGRTAAADSVYRAVARRWPTADYAARARFHLATLALRRGDTATALGWYDDEVTARGAQRLAARYEMARVLSASGDTAGAARMLEELARQDPIGYYGTMARLTGALPAPEYPQTAAPVGGLAVQRTLATLDLLQRLDWMDEAQAVVDEALSHRGRSANDALALGTGLIDRGWVAQGVTLGWRAAESLGTKDPRVLRVIFPWPLRGLIEAEAAKHELDPYLVAGLIRQESTFRTAVISRAGATGLMQLMPSTAGWLARRLGVDWNERFLTVADANLHLGAAHLAGLLQRYDGSVVFALAAYNAGGRPVDRWRRFPEARDPFQFVERIPYVETRGYVRAVLRNRELYRALYPGPTAASEAQAR
jgi:soluble lytic murein transglycosylase-like protein